MSLPPIKTLEDFYAGATPFVRLFDAFVEKNGLETKAQADHICYKCDSSDSFEYLRRLFEPVAPYLYQALIAGRRIAVIRLPRPIPTLLGPIHFLELSDQKPDNSQTNRFDHIEAYPVSWSYDELVSHIAERETVVKADRPHHPTHDIVIGDSFLFRCTREPLIEKIIREELHKSYANL